MAITAATLTSISEDRGTSSTDYITSDNILSISGTVSGTGKIKVFAVGATTVYLGTVTISASGTWTLASTVTIPDGLFTLEVHEQNGNDVNYNGTTLATHTLSVDTVAASAVATVTAISADSGTAGDYITNVAAQTVSGTFTGTLGGTDIIQVSVNGVNWTTATTSGNTWSASGVTLASGNGTIQVRTTDTAGTTAVTGIGHSYTLDAAVPTAVATVTTLSADSGAAGDFVTNTAAQTVSGTYSGTLGSGEKIQVSLNGTTWVDATASAGNWSASGITLSGTGNIQVRTIDTAGNTTAGTGHSFTLDTAPPTFGAITVAGDDHITTTGGPTGEENNLHVTGSVTGADGQTITVTLLANDGSTVIQTGTGAIGVGGAYDVTFTGLQFPAGPYKVKVSATDVAGNTGTSLIETFDSSVCFLAGTMIRTADGEKAIETLVPGDLVVTADGSAKPVKFIGRQTISLIFADKLKSQPIIIKAGALGENSPSRDLYTSPGHSMLVDGNLVIASAMVNGRSIVRWEQSPGVFAYYHVELEQHAVIFANDAATETYCDNVPREVFDNAREYKALYPNALPIKQLNLPTVKSQRQLPAETRKRLAERAAAVGAAEKAA